MKYAFFLNINIFVKNDHFVRGPPYKRVFSPFLLKKNGIIRLFFRKKSRFVKVCNLIDFCLFLLFFMKNPANNAVLFH